MIALWLFACSVDAVDYAPEETSDWSYGIGFVRTTPEDCSTEPDVSGITPPFPVGFENRTPRPLELIYIYPDCERLPAGVVPAYGSLPESFYEGAVLQFLDENEVHSTWRFGGDADWGVGAGIVFQ